MTSYKAVVATHLCNVVEGLVLASYPSMGELDLHPSGRVPLLGEPLHLMLSHKHSCSIPGIHAPRLRPIHCFMVPIYLLQTVARRLVRRSWCHDCLHRNRSEPPRRKFRGACQDTELNMTDADGDPLIPVWLDHLTLPGHWLVVHLLEVSPIHRFDSKLRGQCVRKIALLTPLSAKIECKSRCPQQVAVYER